MVLSGAVVFPHGLLPLFIFEPRYREMLEYALQNDRVFCIGNTLPGVDPEEAPDPVHPVTTAGLIRACVTHDDGTSHLMLAGIQRVRLVGWEQVTPFRIARIAPLDDVALEQEATASVKERVLLLCEEALSKAPQSSDLMSEHLRSISDPSALSDVVAQNFVNDVDHRQRLIETLDVKERLQLLATFLATRVSDDLE